MNLNQLIYRFSRPVGGLTLAKYLARKHPRILMYHRVRGQHGVEGIPVDLFRWQLKKIKQHFNPMALDQMVDAHECNRLPDHAVALTFDDGYRDFYELAYPLLKEFDLPATLFLTTGFVSGELWLWPDQIKYILSETNHKVVEILDTKKSLTSESDRYEAWSEIGDTCLRLTNTDKHLLIERIAKSLEVSLPPSAPEGFEGLNWNMVKEMKANSRLTIGSHSVSHPIMTSLSPKALSYELLASKETIETETGQPVSAFCYPNGQPEDINDITRVAIQHSGYAYALAAYPAPDPLRDRWAIARYPGASTVSNFEKSIYGMSYLATRHY